MKEATIKRNILRYLRALPNSKWMVSPPGSQPGQPDILGSWGGVFVAIEVKNEIGKLTKLQKFELDTWDKAGAITFVARSVKDLEVFRVGSIKGNGTN